MKTLLVAIGLLVLGCGGEAGDFEGEEGAPEAEPAVEVEANYCCEWKTQGFLVRHFCQTTPVDETYLELNPGGRCWEVP